MELKIAVFIFLISVSNVLAIPAYSQVAKVSLDMENKSLEQVMDEIESQSEFYFIFNQKQIDVNRVIDIQAEDELITDILPGLFKGTNVNYVVFDRKILLTSDPLDKDIQALAAKEMLQQRQITGNVTEKDGTPLAGVSVVVKGTDVGTLTDENGKFTITIPPDGKILVFSFIGMGTQDIEIGSSNVYDIILSESMVGLDEVVVVGYGTESRTRLIASVGEVKNKDIAEIAVGNLTTALSGKVAGLQVINRQSQPGEETTEINIRGFGNPLILVDGIEQDFANLDPNSIESISILKDASASIYGARAGNGVVLVTTKRGLIGKPQFNFKTVLSMSQPTKLVKFVDAPTYAILKNEANISDGLAPLYTAEEIEKFRTGTDPNYPNTDWWNETFTKWAPMQDYNLNVTGGNESIRYFASLGYKNQGSMLRSKDMNFKRYEVRSNVDVNFTKAFSASFDLYGRLEKETQPGFMTTGQGGAPFPSIMEAIQRAKPTVAASFPDPTKVSFAGYEELSNPVALSHKDMAGYIDENNQDMRGTMRLKYDFGNYIKGLSAEGSFDYRIYDTELKRWTTAFTYYDYDYDLDIYTPRETYNEGKNKLQTNFNRTNYWKSTIRLDYKNTFLSKHNISGFLLYEAISDNSHNYWLYREGFLSKTIDQFFAGSDINKDNGGSATEDARAAYVGRFNYNFDNKYLVEFLFRYDASPRFSPENRWGFFPGLSIGWRLGEEDFIKNINLFDELKLRASYGEAGDEANVRFNYLTGYEFSGVYVLGLNETVVKSLGSTGLANPDAVWAKTKTYNIGLDGIMFNNLLSFDLDFFYREKRGILAARSESVPSTFGASLPLENINSLNDRGLELVIGHNNRIGNISYYVKMNASWARSKWMHYDEPEYSTEEEVYRYKLSGTWRNITYGYLTDGLFSSQEEIAGWADITNGAHNNVIKPGDIRYLDLNNDNLITWKDERIIGKSDDPTIYYGMNAGIAFKNIDFSTLWQGATGFTKFYSSGFRAPFRIEQVPFDIWQGRWTEDNPDPNSTLPRIRNGNPSAHPNTDRQSTWWMIQDAYFIRFKEARLSYKMPDQILQKLGNINLLEFYVAGTNLATITNVKYLDPEASNQSFLYYPQQRTYSFGINVKF